MCTDYRGAKPPPLPIDLSVNIEKPYGREACRPAGSDQGGCAKAARSSAPSRPGWQGDRPWQPLQPRLEGGGPGPGHHSPIGPAYE